MERRFVFDGGARKKSLMEVRIRKKVEDWDG
jgi:hypothetical protein